MLRIGASVTRTKPVPERTAYALCLSQVPRAHRTPPVAEGHGQPGGRAAPCCPLVGEPQKDPEQGMGEHQPRAINGPGAEARHGQHGFLDEAERRIGPNVFRKKEADPRCDDSEDG